MLQKFSGKFSGNASLYEFLNLCFPEMTKNDEKCTKNNKESFPLPLWFYLNPKKDARLLEKSYEKTCYLWKFGASVIAG